MHNYVEADTDYTSDSSPGRHNSICSGMFSGAQNLHVTGHTLTNITHNHPVPPTKPSGSFPQPVLQKIRWLEAFLDFKMVPLGDIDLQHEICLENGTSVVDRRHKSRRVRRIYSANVGGQSMTVAMYQGPGAEKAWRMEIRTCMSIRHPNILQICGAAGSGGIHAILFHGDLIPFEHFLDLHQHCHFSTMYIYIYCSMDFRAATDYVDRNSQSTLNQEDYTLWIRRSTGRLCAELMEPVISTPFYFCDVVRQTSVQNLSFWNALDAKDKIIESLTIDRYHYINYYGRRNFRSITISSTTGVKLAAILCCSLCNRTNNYVVVSFLRDVKVYSNGGWTTLRGALGERTTGGWTRFDCRDIFDSTVTLQLQPCYWAPAFDSLRCWFSQANHIFSRLRVTSNFEDYFLVDRIDFELKVLPTAKDPLTGYLFLCSEQDLQTSLSSLDSAAYWSLHPSGVERLDANAATALGFPPLRLKAEISGKSWDSSVYAGIRQFHQAKGFDPESQDVARNLGLPLYQLVNEIDDSPFAHVEKHDSQEEENDQNPLNVDTQRSASDEHGCVMSMERYKGHEALRLPDEMSDASTVLLFLTGIQFTLILCLALSWMWGRV